MKCIYCDTEFSLERYEIGYKTCMDKSCVLKALQEKQSKVRLINMPKQGFAYVFVDSPDLKYGKSSGRQ